MRDFGFFKNNNFNKGNMRKIECVIMDWAGTSVDYGCFAPVAAFVESFRQMGVTVTPAETRAHMGLTKIEEVRALFAIDRVADEFRQKYGRTPGHADVEECYRRFQEVLFGTLEDYTDPIPEVVEVIGSLRAKGIKIGSTTGYTQSMMDVVVPAAERKGYRVDTCVTSDGLPGGRPKPYMIYQNVCRLDVPSRFSVLKYGDTIADIREGVNAGVWSVGVVMGGNELGLTQHEAESMPPAELKRLMAKVRDRMYAAGADYVVDTIGELPMLIEDINERMAL